MEFLARLSVEKAGIPNVTKYTSVLLESQVKVRSAEQNLFFSPVGECTNFQLVLCYIETKFILLQHLYLAKFSQFVKAIGYQTQAARFGASGMFERSNQPWIIVDSANWRYPRGPEKALAPPDHPVTQGSWNDVVAYCKWIDKRLLTGVEWELAARNAQNGGPRYA